VTWALEAGVRHVDSATCAFRASSRWRALAAASFQRFAAGPILTYPVFGCRRVRERGCLQEGDRGFLREERRPPVGGLLHDQAARADDVRQGGRGDPVLGRARPGRLRRPLPDALGHRRAPAPRGELARVRVGQEGEARPEHRRLQLCVPRQRLSPRHQARLTALLARSARGCQAHRGARRARRRRVEARDRLAPVDQSGTPASCQEPTVRATERATTDARARFGSPSDRPASVHDARGRRQHLPQARHPHGGAGRLRGVLLSTCEMPHPDASWVASLRFVRPGRRSSARSASSTRSSSRWPRPTTSRPRRPSSAGRSRRASSASPSRSARTASGRTPTSLALRSPRPRSRRWTPSTSSSVRTPSIGIRGSSARQLTVLALSPVTDWEVSTVE
jgi:hypothetical protein